MKRFKYVFYRYYQRTVHGYHFFEEALHSFVSDFDHGKAYGIGIHDQESKVLYLPDYFDEEQHSQSIKEMERLGYKIKKIKTFEV